MEKEDPAALKHATDLLKTFKIRSHGEHVNKEDRFPFVECATLADDIKYIGGSWQSDWHFTDIPWFGADIQDFEFPELKWNPQNLTSTLPQMV